MLAKRVIPCLDVDRGRVVKGVKFVELRDAGDPVECAMRYDAEGADELVFLDITASSDAPAHRARHGASGGRRRLPALHGGWWCALGGGRRPTPAGGSRQGGREHRGRVGSGLVERLALRFGSQATVLAVDARRKAAGGWEVYVHGGRTPTGRDAVEWVREGAERGAGEILLTSMDKDGTKDGFDVALTRAVAETVRVPVIASGGCGTVAHMAEVLSEGKASAALAASIFHFGEIRLGEARAELRRRGIEVRP